jgi:hypothetical protein
MRWLGVLMCSVLAVVVASLAVVVASPAVAEGQSAARIQETGPPPITYTGTWIQGSTARAWSGGTAAHSGEAAARATLSFSGTAVSWIGFRGPQTGIARVFVDGVQEAEVDTFAPEEEVEVALFTRSGLAPGPHTLVIEVTGTQNPASTDLWIVVDAFDVDGTRVQETGLAAITYTGGWIQGSAARSHSGSTAAVSGEAGARATLSFAGTAVSWIGFRGPQTGIARVFVDGVQEAEVDTFFQAPVTYTGTWTQGDASRAWSGGTAAVSGEAAARATLSFSGTAVSWIGFRGPQTGIARVFVDGVQEAEVDTFAPAEEVQVALFTRSGLAEGPHTLVIEVTGTQNPASTNTSIVVDAFKVDGTRVVQETCEETQVVLFTRSELAAGPHMMAIEVTGTRNPASTDTLIVVDAFDVTP